ADIEPESRIFMWDAFKWDTGNQVQHLRTFAEVRGQRYRELVPGADMIMPNKSAPDISYYGWSYCARTPDRDLFLIYFENEAPEKARLRGVTVGDRYRASVFDPREGIWHTPGDVLTVPDSGMLELPARPD